MIRINLLGLKKEVTRSRMPSVSVEGAKATALLVVILAVAVALLAGHYYKLTNEKAQLDKELAAAETEKARLAQVKTAYEEFQKRTQLLSRRINIIEGLKKAQTGPVTLLSTLANTVEASGPLWLTSFGNEGARINLEGVANSVNTVADFITNLKRCGQFKNVEIKETYEDSQLKDVSTFFFSVSAELVAAQPAGGGKS